MAVLDDLDYKSKSCWKRGDAPTGRVNSILHFLTFKMSHGRFFDKWQPHFAVPLHPVEITITNQHIHYFLSVKARAIQPLLPLPGLVFQLGNNIEY